MPRRPMAFIAWKPAPVRVVSATVVMPLRTASKAPRIAASYQSCGDSMAAFFRM